MANKNTGAVYTAADGIAQGNPAQDSENTSGKSSENAADVQISAERTDRTVPLQEILQMRHSRITVRKMQTHRHSREKMRMPARLFQEIR